MRRHITRPVSSTLPTFGKMLHKLAGRH